jgi:hypothetical protein
MPCAGANTPSPVPCAHTALSVQPTDGSSGLDFGLFVSFRSDGYGFKFIFAPTGWIHTWSTQNQVQILFFTRRCTETQKGQKKPETQKKPWKEPKQNKKKSQNLRKNPMKIWKKIQKKYIYKIWWIPEPDLKPDGFRCQFSPVGADSNVKFNLILFFCWSSFR